MAEKSLFSLIKESDGSFLKDLKEDKKSIDSTKFVFPCPFNPKITLTDSSNSTSNLEIFR